jgi:hypothetical protein
MSNCDSNIIWVPATWGNEAFAPTSVLSNWSISGQNSSNTDACKLYVYAYTTLVWGEGIGIPPGVYVNVLVSKSPSFLSSVRSSGSGASRNLAFRELGIYGIITPDIVAAASSIQSEASWNDTQILQSYNGSGISGSVWTASIWRSGGNSYIGEIGTLYFGDQIPLPPQPTTTTTTTYPGPHNTTTPTTTTATTTAPTSTTTTTTPLKDVQTIQYLNGSQTEIVTHRYGALSYGTMAPGETGKTIIVSLFAPYVKAMNNISLGLTDTGGIEFDSNVFSIASSMSLDPTIVPSVSFIGVNNVSSSTSNFNFGIPNKDSHTSAYIYLNVKLPRDNFIGTGTIRYKFFFDYSD